MRGFLLFVLLAAAVLLVVPYLVLPAVLESLISRELQSRLGLAERPVVELDSDPQWEMLAGRFSRGRVSVGGANLGGVRAEDLSLDLDPFNVDVGESVRSRTTVLGEPASGRVRVRISEEEVSRLARSSAQMPVNGVEVDAQGVTVESEAAALGTTFPVSVVGGVGVEGGDFVFRPEALRAAGLTVPEYLAESLLAGTAFRYPVGPLPYGGTLTGARSVDGAVVLTGRVRGVEISAG